MCNFNYINFESSLRGVVTKEINARSAAIQRPNVEKCGFCHYLQLRPFIHDGARKLRCLFLHYQNCDICSVAAHRVLEVGSGSPKF